LFGLRGRFGFGFGEGHFAEGELSGLGPGVGVWFLPAHRDENLGTQRNASLPTWGTSNALVGTHSTFPNILERPLRAPTPHPLRADSRYSRTTPLILRNLSNLRACPSPPRPISWNREADRLGEQAHEREIKELKERANAPIRAALETGTLAKIFGDDDKGRLIAAMMSDLNHAFDPSILTNRKPSPPQSAAPIRPNQTGSNSAARPASLSASSLLREQLNTLGGRNVRVLHPGFHSRAAGPDFRGMVLQFGSNSHCDADRGVAPTIRSMRRSLRKLVELREPVHLRSWLCGILDFGIPRGRRS
jgi:hypothetical protein